MSHYFINNDANNDGSHEVHKVGCKSMPTDKRYLGNFYEVSDALMEARKEFWHSSGCERCMRDDHADTRLVRVGGHVASWSRFR
jgi:hypothetical protein